MAKESKGSCLCGKVAITVTLNNTGLHACHCNTCRKWGGGPLFGYFHEGLIALKGKEYVSTYNSSDWAERSFCKHCGSHLLYKIKGQDIYSISAWILDDVENIHFDSQVFIDKKPAYYSLADKTEEYTEEQVLAMYASESQK
ncbi:GFA family protein [Zophobihabitans entericus]|uniref:GFA family protein n=1 Tax=Zophobihabitans entericus TaxID=1635327 RepID=A0A6G9ICI7_9GAMM|nr:GFA family protein [Zophobihabitans entericus]QIQ21946.1 GFA family protein [Zophobihabitans entericus]